MTRRDPRKANAKPTWREAVAALDNCGSFISVPRYAQITGRSLDAAYKDARAGAIPGLVSICGSAMRIRTGVLRRYLAGEE